MANPKEFDLEQVSVLLAKLGLKHEKTLKSINQVCQDNLLRKAGAERWQIEHNKIKEFESKRLDLEPIVNKLGLHKEITPCHTQYDYLIILGAIQKTMQKRFVFAEKLLKSGIFPRKGIILLSSERPTDTTQEDLAVGATEAESMKNLFQQSKLAQEPYILVVAPMKGKDKTVRATTEDTVHQWLSRNPEPGRCLVISNQPFVQRQTMVLQAALPATFIVEGVGAKPESDTTMAIYLDELARTVYQMKLLQDKQ